MTRHLIDDFVAGPLRLTLRGRSAPAGGMGVDIAEPPDVRPFICEREVPAHFFCEALCSGIHIRSSGQEYQVWDSFNTQTIQMALPASATVIFGVTLSAVELPRFCDFRHDAPPPCETDLWLARPEPIPGLMGKPLVTFDLPVGSLRLCDLRPIDQPPPSPITNGLTLLEQTQAKWRGQGVKRVLTRPILNAGGYADPPIQDRIASAKVATPGHRQRRWHKRYFFHKDSAKPHLNTSIVYRDQTGAISYAEEFTRRPDGEMVTTAFEFED
jgi:hypothetical protein